MTTINICFNCRHWDEDKIVASNHRHCKHPSCCGEDDGEEDGCSIEGQMNLDDGRFATGPKFGCIHFEA